MGDANANGKHGIIVCCFFETVSCKYAQDQYETTGRKKLELDAR
jgi:hypothetical protein